MTAKKYLLILFLTFLVAYPSPVPAKSNRGIAVTATGQPSSAVWGNYHALIIGINAYKEWNPLQTAAKDAVALSEILIRRYSFKKENVILLTDGQATLQRIVGTLRSMATNLEDSDNLLIYYAGHGQLDDITGDGYWIPTEGKLKDPTTWVSQYIIKSILSSEKVRGKNIVVVADSCYSGAMMRGGPSLLTLDNVGYKKRLAKAANKRSRQVITSGGVEPVADGGKDGHSLFAYYLLKALKENDREVIDIENLFHTRVWKYVTEIGDQRPVIGRLKTPMDDDGQFVLLDSESQFSKLVSQGPTQNKREQSLLLLAEKKQLEVEKWQFEAQKQLYEERKQLDAERRKLAEKKLLLASVPKSVIKPRVVLRDRKKSGVNLSRMRKKYNFYDSRWGRRGNFKNDFVDNNDATITDRTSGLIWQKEGMPIRLNLRQVEKTYRIHKYIEKLNDQNFGGRTNWRLPTIEELSSLIEPRKLNGGLHIDPIFARTGYCMSADKYTNEQGTIGSGHDIFSTYYFADFVEAVVVEQYPLNVNTMKDAHIKAVSSPQ